jgi:hypothetical protein
MKHIASFVCCICFYFFFISIIYAGGGHCGGHGCHGGHSDGGVHSVHNILLKKHKGEIILANGDTVYGFVKLNDGIFELRGLSYQKDKLSLHKSISYNAVKSVTIYDADTSLLLNSVTCFYNLHADNHLWRILYNGSFRLYDDVSYVNEDPGKMGDDLVLEDQSGVNTISTWWRMFAWSDLLHFINNRYNTKLRWRDFKSSKNMFRYIAKQDADVAAIYRPL